MDNAGIAFNRFRNDPAFQRGFEKGGRILGQGSLVLGRYGRTISEAPYDSEFELETAMDQEADLGNWARLTVIIDSILRVLAASLFSVKSNCAIKAPVAV